MSSRLVYTDKGIQRVPLPRSLAEVNPSPELSAAALEKQQEREASKEEEKQVKEESEDIMAEMMKISQRLSKVCAKGSARGSEEKIKRK
jgi:hypothetical protein